jgi:type I restriction enzyme S subunit
MGIRAGYKKTDLGVIPFDWQIKELSQICNISRGKFSPRPRNNPIYYGGSIPFVQTGDVTKSNGLIAKYTQTLNELGLGVSILFKKGTILMTIAANIGYTGILQLDMACPDSLVAINGHSGISNEFINLWFIYRRQKIEDLSTSGAQKNLNIELLSPFQIPVPKIEEQRAIATALSDINTLISSLEKLSAKKQDIKQAIIQELFKPKVGWKMKSLGDIGRFSKGHGIRKDESQSGTIPCVRYGELYTKHSDYIKAYYSFISKEVSLSSKQIKTGDILFAGSGETKEEIGKCAAFIDNIEAYAGGDIIVLSPTNVNSLFLGYILNSPFLQKQKSRRGQGDAVVHVSAAQLSSVLVPLPPTIEEQTAIAAALFDLDAELNALESKLQKYRQIKSGMMQTLLTGQIRLV